jgi:hypothetical protein
MFQVTDPSQRTFSLQTNCLEEVNPWADACKKVVSVIGPRFPVSWFRNSCNSCTQFTIVEPLFEKTNGSIELVQQMSDKQQFMRKPYTKSLFHPKDLEAVCSDIGIFTSARKFRR